MSGGIVCAVTDRSRLTGGEVREGGDHASTIERLVERLAQAAQAGVDWIQLREPDLSGADLVSLVRRVREASVGTRTRVIVNDRLDVALAAGAAGVHLKGESIGTAAARRLTPAGFLVGRSAHSVDEAVRAAEEGADYVIVGTVFETASKPGRGAAGLALLTETAARCPVPVLGIGGMTSERAADVALTGAAGLAAIGVFMSMQGTSEQVRTTLDAAVAGIRRAFEGRSREDRPWP